MKHITKLLAIAFFVLAIAVHPALADTDSGTSSVEQAAQKVIEDDGAKDQFGQSENGEQLLDRAKTEASKKLTQLKEENTEDLPESKKLFLKNLQPD